MGLTLSRKVGESVVCGSVVVNVVRIGEERVTVNIEAPKDVLILRSELLNKANEDESNGKKEVSE